MMEPDLSGFTWRQGTRIFGVGSKAWLRSSVFDSNWIRMTEIRSFYSAADDVTGSKPSCGKAMVLMYKRLENGSFHWPRSADEAVEITSGQYQMLMQGLEVVARHPIRELSDPPRAM